MYRSALWLGTALWLIVIGGLGYVFARHDALPRYRPVPALAFAGSDLVYVLRRIAAEADLLLALDEARTAGQMEDLRNRFVDVDLGGTTAGGALEALRQEVGGFSYDFRHGLLYVHSATELPKDTGIDRKELPGGRFEGDLRGLGAWIQKMRPATYLSVHLEVGHPAGPKVRLQVPPESSVLDILLLYAKEAGVGWRMRRAGETRDSSTGQLLVLASEVTPWKPLPEAHHTWAFRQVDSLVQILGRIESRTSTPICIADVAPFYANRGTLELALSSDPAYPIEKTLQVLAAAHNSNAAPPFRWEMRDGVAVLYAEALDRFPTVREILAQPLLGGTFRGTLPELARWLTTEIFGREGHRIAGGEIVRGEPAVKLTIEEGSSVEDALVAFSRESGRGWYLVIHDRLRPTSKRPRPWHGAFLSELREWGERATPY